MAKRFFNPFESEKFIEKQLKGLIKEVMGGLCIKLHSQNLTGLPDRLCLMPGGKAFFVEIKSKGKKPRRIQEFIHQKIRMLGFKVYVIDSLDGINQILEDYAQNTPNYDPPERK